MKKMIWVLSSLTIIGFLLWFGIKQSSQKHSNFVHENFPITSPSPVPSQSLPSTETRTLFVPYWTVGNKQIDANNYDQLVYFGIAGTTKGIAIDDPGYKNIDIFLTNTNPSKKRLLTIRLIDSEINTEILADKQMQTTIATQAANIAKEKGFDGIVLDLELSAIRFDSVVKSISDFTSLFAQEVHSKQLSFSMTIYGDTFYRLRPFDVSSLAKDSDSIMIMAYDFHKAKADAGPNFPFQDSDYDFQQMTIDFLHNIPANKLTVLFGMYGYDWTLDDKNQTVGTATTITVLQAKQKFFPCQLKDCFVKHDDKSSETEATYTDNGNNKHEVWFEDLDSVKKKMEFLQSKGISSIGYWAYGYF